MYIDRLIDAIYTIRPLIQIVHGPKCPSDFSWTLSATLMTLVTTAEWATPHGVFLDILGDGSLVETGETWPRGASWPWVIVKRNLVSILL